MIRNKKKTDDVKEQKTHDKEQQETKKRKKSQSAEFAKLSKPDSALNQLD
jgi:hypothetical protein